MLVKVSHRSETSLEYDKDSLDPLPKRNPRIVAVCVTVYVG